MAFSWKCSAKVYVCVCGYRIVEITEAVAMLEFLLTHAVARHPLSWHF